MRDSNDYQFLFHQNTARAVVLAALDNSDNRLPSALGVGGTHMNLSNRDSLIKSLYTDSVRRISWTDLLA